MEKLIGCGAAGNKAVIAAIENGYPRACCLLINSTLKDIDEKYHDIAINIGGFRGGCGKERDVAKKITLASLGEDDTLKVLDSLPDDEDETIYLITSTEGGTGSGATPLLAKYLHEVHGLNVIITAFTGFEDDARGLLNTIDFFRELSDEYVVQIISNKKVLGSGTNKFAAQQKANMEFVKRLQIITVKDIIDSHNNIDETDLFKVISTPGLMDIETVSIKGIKNIDQFNEIVSNMIDNSFSVDFYDPKAQRIAIYLDIEKRTLDAIDFEYNVIKDKLGLPFELFQHIQHHNKLDETISIISTGMNMPLDEMEALYDRYMKNINIINKKSDDFFDKVDHLTDNSSIRFNTAKRKRGNVKKDKSSFLKQFVKDENIEIEEINMKDNIKNSKAEYLKTQVTKDSESV